MEVDTGQGCNQLHIANAFVLWPCCTGPDFADVVQHIYHLCQLQTPQWQLLGDSSLAAKILQCAQGGLLRGSQVEILTSHHNAR